MPGHHLLWLDLELLRELGVELSLHLVEGLVGHLFELVEDGQQSLRVVFLEADLHLPVVLVPELRGRFVAGLGEGDDLRTDLLADLLERFPDGLALLAVLFLGEHLEQLVVRVLLAFELCAEGVEGLLDLAARVDHLLEQVGWELVALEGELGDFQRPHRQRIEAAAVLEQLDDLGVAICAGMELLERQLRLGRRVEVLFLS